jgi:hypothetical protein
MNALTLSSLAGAADPTSSMTPAETLLAEPSSPLSRPPRWIQALA